MLYCICYAVYVMLYMLYCICYIVCIYMLKVKIFRLATISPVEQKILERAQFKLAVDNVIIQAGKFDNRTSATHRKELLKTILSSNRDSSESTAKPPTPSEVSEINIFV